MKLKTLTDTGRRAIVLSTGFVAIFTVGIFVGLTLEPRLAGQAVVPGDETMRAAEEANGASETSEAIEPEPDHVELTPQAARNLDLTLGPVTYGDYWESLLVPARVVEVPGRSDLSVSAPVEGVVETVNIVPGQALSTDSELMVIRITDEALTDTQTKLLETITQQAIAEQELERIAPLVRSGAVSGNVRREREYELRQLEARRSTLIQELRGRGMPESMVASVLEQQRLLTKVTIAAPNFVGESESPSGTMSTGYSIENLYVHPGMSVSKGTELCSIAFHAQLYLEATAFEADLPVLERIAERGWTLVAESHDTLQHNHPHSHVPVDFQKQEGLELLRVDNHVDEESQTVRFYVELNNSITRIQREGGRLFEQWKYRPGQRLHLRLPVRRWERQFVLPVESVAIDGINAYVFSESPLETERGIAGAEAEDDAGPQQMSDVVAPSEAVENAGTGESVFDIFPIPVQVAHRDDRVVVIADDGQLIEGDRIAMNSAYKLYLAWKTQSGGGGHDHHHDH